MTLEEIGRYDPYTDKFIKNTTLDRIEMGTDGNLYRLSISNGSEYSSKDRLYTKADVIATMENLLYDMRNSDGGEGALIVDGQKFYTDAGFALEGVEIFIKLFKQRMEVKENVDTNTK